MHKKYDQLLRLSNFLKFEPSGICAKPLATFVPPHLCGTSLWNLFVEPLSGAPFVEPFCGTPLWNPFCGTPFGEPFFGTLFVEPLCGIPFYGTPFLEPLS